MTRLLAAVLLLTLPALSVLADDDQDRVLQLRQQGRVLPLEQILDRLDPSQRARILEVELEQEEGRVIYEVKYVDPAGRILKLVIDARTGERVQVKGH